MEEATLKPIVKANTLFFNYLPGYAQFIRENHLKAYIGYQLKGAKELNTPLLKIFGDMPDEQIIEASISGHTEFLRAAEENKLQSLLHTSMKKWINDQLEIVGRDEIEAEDITQVSYLRKNAMVHFLPLYTSDITTVLEIIKELDNYILESDTIAISTYIDILQSRIAARTEALRQSEEQLLEAQNIAEIGSFYWDLTAQKIQVSPQLLQVLDLEHTGDFEYFINKVHPSDKPKIKAAMEEAYKTGNYECEYRLETSDGKEKIIWSRGIVSFKNNKPYHFKGTVMNVTEKYYMVQRLQRSEELYKQAQALSHIGNYALDLLHNKLTWSDELYKIYDLEIGTEITYNYIYSFNHPEDAEKVASAMQTAIENQQPFEFYYRIKAKDGGMKILLARGEVLSDNGKPFKVIGTLQDVTKEQQAEQQIRTSQEFIQKIANTTPSLIASYNVDTGTYTFINKSLQAILGYDSEEVFKKGTQFFTDIIHPDDLSSFIEKDAQALEEANVHLPENGNEIIVEFKYRMRHKNGKYLWFHTFSTVFDRNSEGKVVHVLNVSVDITDQEIAEQKLQQKNIELQQSNASLEEYAFVASHDLKEPLRKIATFSDRLLSAQQDRLNEDGKLYLNKIIESSRRMQTMISDLLAISVISGNKSFEVHRLKDILSEVLQTLEYKIEEKSAVITSDELPPARIIPSQFRQLFQNLISNSLKFAREGIAPVIKITHSYLKPEDVTEFNLTKANKYLKITVTDNGIGFDNQFANKIFAIFQRLHGKTEYEGTGIGLAICKKIVENHSGTITANGTINQGATFTIIIPV